MIFSFSALIVFALFIFLFISLQYTQTTVYNNSISYNTQIINMINYDIDSYIEYMENISKLVSKNKDVQQYLFSKDSTAGEIEAAREGVLNQFNTVKESRSDISNIVVMAQNGRAIVNDGQDLINEYVDINNTDLYINTMRNSDNTFLSSSHVQNLIKNNYRWVVTLSRCINNPQTNEKTGLFFIDLNYDIISDLCEKNGMGKRGYVYIIDSKGSIVYHPKQQLLYSGLIEERIDEVLNSKKDYFVTKEGDDSRLYTISKSARTGWTVVGVDYTSELMTGKESTQIIYVVIAIALVAITMVISSLLAATITKPITALKESMKEAEKGNFEITKRLVHSNNEVGSLSQSFYVMIEEIQNLMKQNISEQKQKRKSELKALQSQINPHFLFNTLDSIIWMAEEGKNEDVVLMTSSLAKLMRQSLSVQSEVILIENEIEYAKSYLIIQKMRYKDKLEFEINVEDGIKEQEIIKLVLQPIVENAIYHGVKYRDKIGLIKIDAYSLDENIVIAISDNGAGMDEETLAHIFDEDKKSHKSNGVGVCNVQKRLQLYYGQEYGIYYESELGVGTCATIIIPGKQREL